MRDFLLKATKRKPDLQLPSSPAFPPLYRSLKTWPGTPDKPNGSGKDLQRPVALKAQIKDSSYKGDEEDKGRPWAGLLPHSEASWR